MLRFALMFAFLALQTASGFVDEGNDYKNPRAYGEAFSDAPGSSIGEILANGEKWNKKTVVVEGTVADVCQNKGCWTIITDGENSIRVDFKNYGFFIPWDSEGKRISVKGKVYRKVIDKNVAKHWAEEQKNPTRSPDEIVEDEIVIMITAAGVIMENGSELSTEQEEVVRGEKTKEH